MKTEKLKQNVKGYVHQFEDGGLRLLRKGQKGVIHAIFSRFGLVLILLLLQVGLLFSIFRWFGNLWPHYFGGSVVVTSAMVIYLLNSKMDNSAKITWMVVIAIAPVVGKVVTLQHEVTLQPNIHRHRHLGGPGGYPAAAGAGGSAARLATAEPKGRGAAESA